MSGGSYHANEDQHDDAAVNQSLNYSKLDFHNLLFIRISFKHTKLHLSWKGCCSCMLI